MQLRRFTRLWVETPRSRLGTPPDWRTLPPATNDLRDADQRDLIAGNAPGPNTNELGKETRLDDVATSAPLRRTQRPRKKTRKAFELDFCDSYP